jgi:hypothetical protein
MVNFKDIQTRFGSSNINRLSYYFPGGPFASNINFTVEEESSQLRLLSTLATKYPMSVLNATASNDTVYWSGSNYSFMNVTWGVNSSNIPYGTFSFKIPSVTANTIVTLRPSSSTYKEGTMIASATVTPAQLYAFSSHQFNAAGATGYIGPTLTQCTNTYTASWRTNTAYFNMTIQGRLEIIESKLEVHRVVMQMEHLMVHHLHQEDKEVS